MFSVLYSEGKKKNHLSRTHRVAFTMNCCIQHFPTNAYLGLSPTRQCKVPDQTCISSCKATRKANSVWRMVLGNKNGNSYILSLFSLLRSSEVPSQAESQHNNIGRRCFFCLVRSSKGQEGELISASQATGQVLLAEDGHSVPRQSQTAMNISPSLI